MLFEGVTWLAHSVYNLSVADEAIVSKTIRVGHRLSQTNLRRQTLPLCVWVEAARSEASIPELTKYNRGYTFVVMKTAISIPDEIFQAAETLAQRLDLSRSELYSKAVSEYMRNHRHENVTAELNRIYEQECSELDEELTAMQLRSIPKEDWE